MVTISVATISASVSVDCGVESIALNQPSEINLGLVPCHLEFGLSFGCCDVHRQDQSIIEGLEIIEA